MVEGWFRTCNRNDEAEYVHRPHNKTYQRCVHIALEERNPCAAFVACGLINIPLELVKRTDASVYPFGNEVRGQQLPLSVFLLLDRVRRALQRLQRHVQVRKTVVQRAVRGDVPTNGDVREPAKSEVCLPFETFDVAAQHVRVRAPGRVDPEGRRGDRARLVVREDWRVRVEGKERKEMAEGWRQRESKRAGHVVSARSANKYWCPSVFAVSRRRTE